MSNPNKPPTCPKHGTRMRFVGVVMPITGRNQCEWRCTKCRRVYKDVEVRELSRLKEGEVSEQAMMCPQCGEPMTCNGRVDTPPISWQMQGYTAPFTAYRWFCPSCSALFDYTAEGRLLGRLGRMGEYYPVQTRRERSEN